MKYLIALAFLAVASALAPEPLNTAKAFAPIDLTDAVRVVDEPTYQVASRSELETIRVQLPEAVNIAHVETVRVVEMPVDQEVPVPVGAEAEEKEQVRVAEAPLLVAPETMEQVRVVEVPQPVPEMPAFRPMPHYDNDMLR